MGWDHLLGEEVDDDELSFREQLRESVAAGELDAKPLEDGSWEIGLSGDWQRQQEEEVRNAPQQASSGQSSDSSHVPTASRPPKVDTSLDTPKKKKGVFEAIASGDVDGKELTGSKKAPAPEEEPEPVEQTEVIVPKETIASPTSDELAYNMEGATTIEQGRARLTGIDDPEVNNRIFEAWQDMPWQIQEELAGHFKDLTAPVVAKAEDTWTERKADGSVVTHTSAAKPERAGMSPQEAWDYMFKKRPDGSSWASETLQGNASHAAWEQKLDKIALQGLDPVTSAGKATLGEERWESLPGGVQTAASWAPILIAPQKGIFKDLLVGGLGAKAGAAAIGGAVVGGEVANQLGANETVGQFAGGIAAPAVAARLAARWAAVENAMRYARANLDEGIDESVALELQESFEQVKNAPAEEMVTVYHGTDEASALSIQKDGFRVGGFVTTDPEVAQVFSKVNSRFAGDAQPVVVAFQVPRSQLATTPENPVFFKAKGVFQPIQNEAVDGFVENATRVVRDFLKAPGGMPISSERGSFILPGGKADDAVPDDVAKLAFGGPDLDAMAARRDEVVAQLRQLDAASSEYDSLLGELKSIDIETNAASRLESSDDILAVYEAGTREASDVYVRDHYRDAVDKADSLADAVEMQRVRQAAGKGYDESANEEYMRSLDKTRRWGEELYRRTGGKEGMAPRIQRAVKQFLAAEEGRLTLPSIKVDAISRAQAAAGSAERVVKTQPATHTVRLTGVQPVNPHLTKRQKIFNVAKAALNTNIFGALADPLGTAISKEYRRVRNTVLESQANRGAARLHYLVGKNFDIDKKTLRLKDVTGNPTLQDLAAAYPEYKLLLNEKQVRTMETIRQELEPYYNAMIEQGIPLRTRADIIEGGFYIPRGRADVEDRIDLPKVGSGGGGKKGFEKEAVFDSMAQAIEAGYRYDDYAEVFHSYFMDSGTRVLDAHFANVLKNSTDEAGRLLMSTPQARLLADPKNARLSSQVAQLRKNLASLSRSVEGMDNRIHGIWDEFVHTPAPDLDKLRYAMNNLFTKNGQLRVRPGSEAQKLSIRDLREAVRDELFTNRGKYAGLTQEQARKAAMKDAVAKQRVRRGQFKGITYEEGTKLLNDIKATIAGIEPEWQRALRKAQQTPRDYARIEPRGIGSNLQNYTFPDQLASSLNDFLKVREAPGWMKVPLAGMQLVRGLRATADISFLGIQGLLGAVYEPHSYRRALGGAFQAMYHPDTGKYVLGKFIDDFDNRAVKEGMPTTREWAAAGLRFGGIDTEMMINGGIGNLPVLKQSNRAFGYFGDILRMDGANAHLKGRLGVGVNPLTPKMPPTLEARKALMKEIATAQNLMTGWSPGRLGGDAGNVFLFAPRFFQSQLELLAKSVSSREVSGQMARGMFRNLLGTGVLLTVAINEQFGDENFDYTSFRTSSGHMNPNFMRARIPGVGDVSMFGPWDSLLKATVAASDGDPDYILRTKASPLVSMMWDTLTGETFMGEKAPQIKNLVGDTIGEFRAAVTGTEYESSGDFGLMGDYFLRSFLPLSFGDTAAEIAQGDLTLKEGVKKIATGTTGVKASPLTLSEQRDQLQRSAIGEMLEKGVIPPTMAQVYKDTPFHELSSAEKKAVDKYIAQNHPEQEVEYREGRRESENIYQSVADQADAVRAKYEPEFAALLSQLLSGGDAKVIWEAYDDKKNKLAGELANIYEGSSKESKKYQEEVAKLEPSDIRLIEEQWNALTGDVFEDKKGALTSDDWDAIDAKKTEFLQRLERDNPQMAARFAYSLKLKAESDLESANPMEQIRKKANADLQPYYEIVDAEKAGAQPEGTADKWLRENPQADFGRWLTATYDNATMNSVAAVEMAIKQVPAREARLNGAKTPITKENLAIVQKYGKEITQLLSLPGTATDAKGKFYPKDQLRKASPLYDALYFWLGFSSPDKGQNVVPVYHQEAVEDYLKIWGVRRDKDDDGKARRIYPMESR